MSRYVIDRKKLDENIETVKKKAGVPVIGVVKGNGYGFGLQNLAKALQAHGIHFFAVTEVDDIAPLRAVAPAEDILVMRSTCIEEEARRIVEAGCTATAFCRARSSRFCRCIKPTTSTLPAFTRIFPVLSPTKR